jgi:hypothetical protein
MILFGLLLCFCIFTLYIIYTNPTRHRTIIQKPFQIKYENNKIVLKKTHSVTIKKGFFWKAIAYYKCAFHIIANVYFGSPKAKGTTEKEIIRDVHRLRFDPKQIYLISGDHFSVQYPRNLGVFYLAMLDSRIGFDEKDWQMRQLIYLQTIAYDLEVFTQHHDITTTIVPLGPKSAAPVNIYAYPSDCLYGILYGLHACMNADALQKMYPFETEKKFSLQTQKAAKELLDMYKKPLQKLVQQYINTVLDPDTRLIKKNIHLSSAKDITIRTCAFYDNVILWKTLQLADELEIMKTSKKYLHDMKVNIIKNFWNEKDGYFYEDLSDHSIKKGYYSSDWLVSMFTGFLSPLHTDERHYFERSVRYIRKHEIDRPLGLKYQQTDRAHRQFPLVRLFVPSYGGSAIWSHWGTEYIKLLVLLYSTTRKKEYQKEAGYQLDQYSQRIVKYKGYPELYDESGNMLSTLFYKSIRQTGWVINYEQAKAMYEYHMA